MSFFDIFRVAKWKREHAAAQNELADVKLRSADALVLSDIQLRERAASLKSDLAASETSIESLKEAILSLQHEVQAKRDQLVEMDDALLSKSSAFTSPNTNLQTALHTK